MFSLDQVLIIDHEDRPEPRSSFAWAAQQYLEEPVFSLDLADTSNAVLNLGAVDKSRYTGNLTTVDTNTCKSSWCFTSVTFSVGGEPIPFVQPRMFVGKLVSFLITYQRWILIFKQTQEAAQACECILPSPRRTMPMCQVRRALAVMEHPGRFHVNRNYRTWL